MEAADPDKCAIRRCHTYARYPRYPQADSTWSDSDSMTASGCGRDDPPATEVSLPSHSPGGCLVPSSDGDRLKRTAGRLTKPPRCGRGRACPSADAKAAGFVKRPSGTDTPSGEFGTGAGPKAFGPEERPGRTPDPRIQDQPGRKRCLRTSALPPARKELRLRRGRAGPGFGPGAANGHGPRASAHGHVRRNQGFGRGSCRTRIHGLRPMKTPRPGRGTRVPNPPSGEPPGLRP